MSNPARKFKVKYTIEFEGISRGAIEDITFQEEILRGWALIWKKTFNAQFPKTKVKVTRNGEPN